MLAGALSDARSADLARGPLAWALLGDSTVPAHHEEAPGATIRHDLAGMRLDRT